ncbi:hypothetical protein E4U26_003217 [Claviceps purpurea]|nr:hypothetical protein E4U26_003217 [Claviceps purpurea]
MASTASGVRILKNGLVRARLRVKGIAQTMAGTAGAELNGELVAAIALGAVDWFAAARDVASTAGVAVLEIPM